MTTYNNGNLPHVWAQQNESNGKNGNGSFSFNGSDLYSYSTLIGKFATSEIVLFTTENYSVTTSQHMSKAKMSVRHKTVFCVPCVDIKVKTTHEYTKTRNKEQHAENIADYKKRIASLILSASRARSNKDFYNDSALNLCEELNNYIKAFKLRNKPYALPNADEIKAKAAKLAKAKARKAKAAKLATIKENKDRIERWLNGELISIAYGLPVMLRIKGDIIQTSQGAEFPIAHGYLALKTIEQCRDNKTTFTPNGKTIKLGHYAIDIIDTNGNVKAGCHKVPYSAIERIKQDVIQWRKDRK